MNFAKSVPPQTRERPLPCSTAEAELVALLGGIALRRLRTPEARSSPKVIFCR